MKRLTLHRFIALVAQLCQYSKQCEHARCTSCFPNLQQCYPAGCRAVPSFPTVRYRRHMGCFYYFPSVNSLDAMVVAVISNSVSPYGAWTVDNISNSAPYKYFEHGASSGLPELLLIQCEPALCPDCC
jgi:hypothetical protein